MVGCSPKHMSLARAPKVSLNRPTVVEIVKQGDKLKVQVLHINYGQERLSQLLSCVERALHKSPSDPKVRIVSLSYLPGEAESSGTMTVGSMNADTIRRKPPRSTALDGTPFSPTKPGRSTKCRKSSKPREFVEITPETFDSKMFLAMDKVHLSAVVVGEGEEQRETSDKDVVHRSVPPNDENDRRLSNEAPPPASTPAGRVLGSSGVGMVHDCDAPPSKSPSVTSFKEKLRPHTSCVVANVSPTSAKADDRSTTDSAAASGKSRDVRGALGGNGNPSGCGDADCSGKGVATSIDEAGGPSSPAAAATPTMSSSRRNPSVETERDGIGGTGGAGGGVSGEESDGCLSDLTRKNSYSRSLFSSDEGGSDRAACTHGESSGDERSCPSSVATTTEGNVIGAPSSTKLPDPGPGKMSVLFRRASVEAELQTSPEGPKTAPRAKSPGVASPTSKRPAAASRAAKTTPQKLNRKQQGSAWAAKPSERRQPPFKPVGGIKAKLPLRTNQPTATGSTRTTTAGRSTPGKAKEALRGGGNSRFGADAVASEAGSPSKRPPPRVSTSGHRAWERNLRSTTKTVTKKVAQKKVVGKRGGRKTIKGSDDGTGPGSTSKVSGDGRPSLGTWTTTKTYLEILKELSGKDDEELQWLAVAKQGGGVVKSEQKRESAETEYHRLLCEESHLEAALRLLEDRRLGVALKAVSKLGTGLERLTDHLEDLAGQENALAKEEDEAPPQEVLEAEAASAAETAAAAAAAVAESAADTPETGNENGGATAVTALEKRAEEAAKAAAVAATAAAARASREAKTVSLEIERARAEELLGNVLEDVSRGKDKVGALGARIRDESERKKVPGGGGRGLELILGVTAGVCSARELVAPSRAKSGLEALEEGVNALAEKLKKTRVDSQSALGKMEKWRERLEALPEYEKEIAGRERAWFAREKASNDGALRRIRSLMPVGVTGMTLRELEMKAVGAGSLYPRELSLRLKENRLLHWVVTHPADIAKANFLRGEHAHFFTNLDKYDVVEMRAITACLPEKFEVDGDGRKAAWRALFLQRVQALVAQERGETVSGGWDPEKNARRTVRLPALTAEQARRREYFYPTTADVEARIEKLLQRQSKLTLKEAKLAEVEEVLLPEAREEYSNVLEDTRHPANKELYSAQDLKRARDEAKQDVERLVKEVGRLKSEVSSAQRALNDTPYGVESLRAEAEATRRLLAERVGKVRAQQESGDEAVTDGAAAPCPDGDARDGDRESAVATDGDAALEPDAVEEGLEVEGPFDPTPELRSRFADKSNSLKFVTAEEDARMRREELVSVFAVRETTSATAVDEADASGSVRQDSEDSRSQYSADSEKGDSPSGRSGGDKRVPADAAEVGARGDVKNRMKAFGAVLEKTLGKRAFGRAAQTPKRAGAASADAVGGGSPLRKGPVTPDKRVVTRCTPKSKLFKTISSPRSPSSLSACPVPPPPPPPPPMMGLMSQIRARGGGAVGASRDNPKPEMGELLAQIRAAKGGVANANKDGGNAGKDVPTSAPAPPPLPRSLFAAAGPRIPTAPAAQGPPPDFFAQLRAKAAEKLALRRAAEAEAQAHT